MILPNKKYLNTIYKNWKSIKEWEGASRDYEGAKTLLSRPSLGITTDPNPDPLYGQLVSDVEFDCLSPWPDRELLPN